MNQISQTTPDTNERPPADDSRYRLAARVAVVAGVFSLIVCALLFYDYSLRRAKDPHEAELFKDLRLAVVQHPDNEQLKEDIRKVDRQLREEYFRHRAFTAVGAGLLLGGIAVFLIAAKSAATLRRKLPTPQPQTTPRDMETQWTGVARWSVAALGVVFSGVVVCLILMLRSDLPEDANELAALLASGSTGSRNGPKVRIVPPPPGGTPCRNP